MSADGGPISLAIECSASRESLPVLLDFVRVACERARLPPDIAGDVRLAAEEACTNVVEHAYAGVAPGPLRVRFDRDVAHVAVTVEDEAAPYDPTRLPPPDLTTPWDDRPIGGLGWHLIRSLMDEVRHEVAAGGNRLTLLKRLAP